MKRLLLGTHNPAKITIQRLALADLPLEILDLHGLGISAVAPEDRGTTAENAESKARFYYAFAKVPTLSMDGGLRIDRFPPEKQPGVSVRRIGSAPSGSERADPDEILNYYIGELEKVGGKSPGTWTGSTALMVSPARLFTGVFTFGVLFTTRRQGAPSSGLDLDPLMVDPGTGRSYTALPIPERPYFRWFREFVSQHLDDLV